MAWVLSALVASGPSDAALPLTGYRPYLPSTGGPTTIDGVLWSSLTAGTSRVLLLNQGGSPGVASASNGIWVYNGLGTANAFSRPTGSDDYVHGVALDNETVVRVSTGAALAHTEHAVVTQGAITVDTTGIAHSRQILRANVRDFGAVGDGSVDDTASIEAAYNSVTSAGGVLTFPAGTYLCNSAAVTIPASVQVEFERGAVLTPVGVQVTIDGQVSGHPTQQLFGGTGTLTSVMHPSGAGPAITVSGSPTGSYSFAVQIVSGGAVGTATFQYSLNYSSSGGTTWSAVQTTAATYAVPSTGLTVAFPSGTYHGTGVGQDLYTWSSNPPVVLTSQGSDSFPVRWWGATGNGTSDDGPALSNAAASIATGELVFAPGTYVVSDGLTTPAGVAMAFKNGSVVNVNGAQLTILGEIVAKDTQQIFSGSGFLSPVTATGTSPPVVAVSGAALGSFSFAIEVMVGGALGTMQFRYTLTASASAPVWSGSILSSASSPTCTLPGTGLTATFSASSYTAGDTYTWWSTVAVALPAPDVLPVKWWGARGDGATDDGLAVQAAIHTASQTPGRTVFFSRGEYVVTCPAGGLGLAATAMVRLVGDSLTGSAINFSGTGTGLLIEPVGGIADLSEVQNLTLQADDPSEAMPLDLLVVHAGCVRVENVALNNALRYGLLIEGDVAANMYGAMMTPGSSQYFNCDFWKVDRVFGWQCGYTEGTTSTTAVFPQPAVNGAPQTVDVASTSLLAGCPYIVLGTSSAVGTYAVISIDSPTSLTLQYLGGGSTAPAFGDLIPIGTTVQIGAAVCVHGEDAGGGVGTLISCEDCNIGIIAGSLVGNTWIQCYSEASRTSYVASSTAASTFLRCGTEDECAFVAPTRWHMIVGGALANAAGICPWPNVYTESVGENRAGLSFSRVGSDGTTYRAMVPCPAYTAPLNFGLTDTSIPTPNTSDWYLSYNFLDIDTFPYMQNSYIWMHEYNNEPDIDERGGPAGMTDVGNPRGVGLAITASPTINTWRHWAWKQTELSLAAGANAVYLKGGVGVNGGGVEFCDQAQLHGPYPVGGATQFVLFTGPPGGPLEASIETVEVIIDTAGTMPGTPGTFEWRLNGTTVASGITMASPYVLGSTGLSVNFPSGSYSVGNGWIVYSLWALAQSNVRCHLEFDNVSDMMAAGSCSVNGVCILPLDPATGYPNLAASVSVANACTATLVWEFDIFVTNYDAGGPIG